MFKNNRLLVLYQHYAEVFKEVWKTRHFDHAELHEKYESEFLPDAIELQETNSAPYLKWITYTLIGMVAIALVWAIFSKVDIVAVASGRLVSDGYTKNIQPLSTAVVKAIYVKNGDVVKAGQLLIQLDDAESLATIKKLESLVPLLTKKVNAYKSLLKDSYVSQHDFFDKERELLEATSQLEQAKFIYNSMSIESPVDGIITSLNIHTVGGVVSPGQLLMSVVPTGGTIALDAYLNNKDVGFVKVGQEVAVKLEAFPFTRYGLIEGKVLSISHDSIEKQGEKPAKIKESDLENINQTTNNYYIKVELSRDYVDVDGQKVELLPGMVATAEVKTGVRRLIGYILSPLIQNVSEAARER